MGIPDQLRAHKQTIAKRWETDVLREVPVLASMPRPSLIDHLPEFLEGLAAWIEGDEPEALKGFDALADGHALQRHSAGIELETLTAEYATLRRIILETLIEHADPAELSRSMVRLAGGIDHAVTEAVKRYAKARDHVRERFIGILAHDLRDPLTAVMMSATLLADMTLGEKQSQLVDRITRSARRIERMIDDVLDFARGRLDGGIPISPRLGDIRDIAQAAVEESRAANGQRTVRLEVTGDLRGYWDYDRLRQTLSNLLANARTYGQGEILVRAWERDDKHAVLVSVTNQGTPIPPELLNRIFDPFSRSNSPNRRGGLGLGLYIVDQIARAHGGIVRAESSSNGTTFTIELPRTPLDETPGRPS